MIASTSAAQLSATLLSNWLSTSAGLGFCMLATVLGAPASSAQEVEGADAPAVTLIGEVRDALSESPVPDASVTIVELGRVVLTDRNGFFRIDSLPQGTWTFRTEHLGYEENVEPSTIGPGNLLLVRLAPRPIELEGLYAEVASGMRRRRASAPSQIWAWDREELSEAVSADIGRFIRTRGVASWVACSASRAADTNHLDLPNCFIRKGRVRVLTVYVDEVPIPGAQGTSTLWAMDPRDLWAVEFLPDCGQLRVYTEWFMEAVRDGRTRLAPALCGW